jgi:hypothetical protein
MRTAPLLPRFSHQTAPFFTCQSAPAAPIASAAASPIVGWWPTTTTVSSSPFGQPAAGEQRFGVRAGADRSDDRGLAPERRDRLLAALRGTDEDARVVGQPLREPRRDALGLGAAAGRQRAFEVAAPDVFGFGVAPEKEVHRLHQGVFPLWEGSRRCCAGCVARRARGRVPVAHNERATTPRGLRSAGPAGDLCKPSHSGNTP